MWDKSISLNIDDIVSGVYIINIKGDDFYSNSMFYCFNQSK